MNSISHLGSDYGFLVIIHYILGFVYSEKRLPIFPDTDALGKQCEMNKMEIKLRNEKRINGLFGAFDLKDLRRVFQRFGRRIPNKTSKNISSFTFKTSRARKNEVMKVERNIAQVRIQMRNLHNLR